MYTRVATLHRKGEGQSASRRVAEEDDATELVPGLVDDGLDDVERVGRGVRGSNRVVRDDDGQAGSVDEALDNPPLAINQGKEVGATVQEDEGTARALTPLREHAGYAFVARRRETSSHACRHRGGLWGVERHLLSCCPAL